MFLCTIKEPKKANETIIHNSGPSARNRTVFFFFFSFCFGLPILPDHHRHHHCSRHRLIFFILCSVLRSNVRKTAVHYSLNIDDFLLKGIEKSQKSNLNDTETDQTTNEHNRVTIITVQRIEVNWIPKS